MTFGRLGVLGGLGALGRRRGLARFLPGAVTDLRFDVQRYMARGRVYAALTDIPGLTASGGVGGTVVRDGVLVDEVAPRVADSGLIVEEQRTNKCLVNAAPTDLTGVVVGGNASATLNLVDDTSALTAAGLASITGGNVYKLDNSAGASNAFADVSGAVGGTVGHAVSVYVRVEADAGNNGVGLNSPIIGPQLTMAEYGAYRRAVYAVSTPASSANKLRVRVGAGGVAYFCLPQLEEGTYATSYIPTDGSAASRSADVITAGDLETLGLTSEVLASGYTIYLQARRAHTGVGFPTALSLTDGADSVEFFDAEGSGALRGRVRVSGANEAFLSSAYSDNVTFKIAFSYAENNASMVVDGGAAQADTSVPLISPDTLKIGRRSDGAQPWGGSIERLAIYDAVLTDAQLQALTAS